MTLPLDELAEALKKATPGPWKAGRSDMTSYDLDGIDPFKNVYVDDDGPSGPVARGYGLSGNEKVAHANAALIVLLRNNADALVEAAKKAKELERAEDCASAAWQREAERLAPLVSSQQTRAEIAEREVAVLKATLADRDRTVGEFMHAIEEHRSARGAAERRLNEYLAWSKVSVMRDDTARKYAPADVWLDRDNPEMWKNVAVYVPKRITDADPERFLRYALSPPPKSAGTKESPDAKD